MKDSIKKTLIVLLVIVFVHTKISKDEYKDIEHLRKKYEQDYVNNTKLK